MTEKQAHLRLLLVEAYIELVHAVDAVPTGDFDKKISGTWSTKDILGHIVSWGDEYRSEIAFFRENPMPDYGYVINKDYQYYEWNQAQADEKATWPWRRIRADLDRDRDEMTALVEQATDADLDICGIVPWKLDSVRPRPTALSRENSCTVQEMLTLLARHIKHHGDIIAKNRRGPEDDLFDAVKHNSVPQVEKLLADYPGLIQARDEAGATALHYAAHMHHRVMIRILIQAGADLNARDDRRNAAPVDWAIGYLRKDGALLAAEIDDAVYALQEKDIPWATRLITRWPALKRACDRQGKPLSAYAEAADEPALISLFRETN